MLKQNCVITSCRILFLIFLLAISQCTVSRTSVLTDIGLNYETKGFLTKNIFQLQCKIKLKSGFKRNRLIEKCRLSAALNLAEYKIRYELVEYNKVHIPDIGKSSLEPAKLNFSWSRSQKRALLELYQDYLPGYIVAEYREKTKVIFIYRIEYKDLIEEVQDKDLPFKIRIAEIELFNED